MLLDLKVLDQLSEEDRKQAAAELTAIDELVDDNPLLKFNNPLLVGPEKVHHKQLAFMRDQARLRAFLGGNRSAKTTGALVDDIIQAIDEEAVPEHLKGIKRWQPPFRCRIVAADRNYTMEEVVYVIIRDWVPRSQLRGGSWETAFDKTTYKLNFANGSYFSFMTYEQDVDKFRGSALERCHFDEEPPRDIYKECRKRLITTRGDIVLSMTPEMGFTDVMVEVWEKRHDKGVSVHKISMDDNPWNSPEEIAEFVEGLTPDEERAFRHGDIVHFAGMVFDKYWSDDLIVKQVAPQSISGQSIVVGIDPGINFTGLVWVAFDDDNCALIFDSMKLQDLTVDLVAEEIMRKNAEWNIAEPDYYVIDPSARNRNHLSSSDNVNAESIEGEYNRHGIYTTHGQNDVSAGVSQLQRRMRAKQLIATENNIQLFDEIDKYRIDPKVDGKFAVIKTNDHILDALRYVVMSRPWIGSVDIKPKGFSVRTDDGQVLRFSKKENPLHPLGDLT